VVPIEDEEQKPDNGKLANFEDNGETEVAKTIVSEELDKIRYGIQDILLTNENSKPSQQFSYNFVVINAFGGSLCFKIFILYNSRCQVLCGSCKLLPRTSLQCCFIILVLRDH
jgi:hypothetical protein